VRKPSARFQKFTVDTVPIFVCTNMEGTREERSSPNVSSAATVQPTNENPTNSACFRGKLQLSLLPDSSGYGETVRAVCVLFFFFFGVPVVVFTACALSFVFGRQCLHRCATLHCRCALRKFFCLAPLVWQSISQLSLYPCVCFSLSCFVVLVFLLLLLLLPSSSSSSVVTLLSRLTLSTGIGVLDPLTHSSPVCVLPVDFSSLFLSCNNGFDGFALCGYGGGCGFVVRCLKVVRIQPIPTPCTSHGVTNGFT
jgi:hypothetical protein